MERRAYGSFGGVARTFGRVNRFIRGELILVEPFGAYA